MPCATFSPALSRRTVEGMDKDKQTDTPDGSTNDEQDFQNPETEEDTASGGPAD